MQRSPELQALTHTCFETFFGAELLPFVDLTGDVLLLGTAPGEWLDAVGLQRQMDYQQEDGLGDVPVEVLRVEAWQQGDIGWSCGEMLAQLPPGPQVIRATAVWRRVADQWRIVHVHTSVAVANEGTFVAFDALAHAVEVEQPDLSSVTAPDGTVTLLFTDIEGSTERNQYLGDREWMGILRAHHDVIREQVTDNKGFEVKSMGDGFMLAFSSARNALRCALDIQHAIAKDDRLDIRVRAGLHAGEAVRDGDDFYGATVNMAARVAGAAIGGEILASSLVRALVVSSGEFAFEAARPAELKGIPGTHELYPLVQ